jgi:sporulation protein YqfC
MKNRLSAAYEEGPLLDMEGQEKLRIEHYQDILELTDRTIRIAAGSLQYQIGGERLWIRALSKREVFLEGTIRSIEIRPNESRTFRNETPASALSGRNEDGE